MNSNDVLHKMKRLSFFARITTVFWFLLFVILYVHQWWGNYLPTIQRLFGADGAIFWSLPFGQRFFGSIGGLCSIWIMFMVIKYLNKFLTNCKNGIIFDTTSFRALHKMVRWLVAYALWVPINTTLESVIKTWHLPQGQRLLTISAGSEDLLRLIGIFFLSLVVLILKEGVMIKKENETVI